ncbi:type II toxin-antitoxin system VapB family antitoxin [Endozoicomonas sp. 2B-B]
MAHGTVFVNNRTQAVRLPAETRFPDDIKKVRVRVRGNDRILSPLGKTWDSFFNADPADGVTDDFMAERASQDQRGREEF